MRLLATAMRRGSARLAGVLAVAFIGMTGCGGGIPAGAVATVGSHAITKGGLEHWIHVVAVRDYYLTPTTPVPSWVIPDPPGFSPCIEHLESTAPAPKPSVAQLKRECRRQYQMLQEQALSFLITGESLISEGEARGLKETNTEVKHRYERATHNEFGSLATFHQYLAVSGETVSDQLFRSRIKLYSEDIVRGYLTAKSMTTRQRDLALKAFNEGFPKKWAARTSCRPGFVVPDCKQYKGPQEPRSIL